MLQALNGLTATTSTVEPISTTVPKLYLFHRQSNTSVLQDFQGATDLKSLLVAAAENEALSHPQASSIGFALGTWLRNFHGWSCAAEQETVRESVYKNDEMRQLKWRITYGALVDILENFPGVFEQYASTVRQIVDMAKGEFSKRPGEDDTSTWGAIHGDFWSGKYVIQP